MQAALILVALSVIVVLASPVPGQDLLPKRQLLIFDANGKVVGPVVGMDQVLLPAVAFKINGLSFAVGVLRHRFIGNDSGSGPFFPTLDCSGPPFVGQGIVAVPIVAVVVPGNTDPLTAPQTITAASRIDQNTGSCVPITPPQTRNARQALRLVDLDSFFTPPFQVR